MTRVARYLISIFAVAGILVYCQKHYWPPLRCSYLPNFRLSERLIHLVIRVRLELSLSSAFCSPSRLRIKLLSQSSTIATSCKRRSVIAPTSEPSPACVVASRSATAPTSRLSPSSVALDLSISTSKAVTVAFLKHSSCGTKTAGRNPIHFSEAKNVDGMDMREEAR